MKIFVITYYDSNGRLSEMLLDAKNERSATRKFYVRYGYYTIKEIKEYKEI